MNAEQLKMANQVAEIMKRTGGKGRYVNMTGMDAATASGLAFIIGELEKQDPVLAEPLTTVDWPRDIVAETGGGFVDYTSTYALNYGISEPGEEGILYGPATAIPSMQADLAREQFPVFTWANNMRVSMIDQEKLQRIGRDLPSMLEDGIRLNSQKTLEKNVYQGVSGRTYGILNNPEVVQEMAATNEAGSSTDWKDKTPMEILHDINQGLTECWAASEYETTKGMPDSILIPPGAWTYLNTQIVSDAGNISILTYLERNNIAASLGKSLSILPSRYCIDAGISGTGRMFFYVNKKSNLYFNLTVPLQRLLSQPSVEHLAYITSFVMQFGSPIFRYFQPTRYIDGIWTGV